MEKVVQLKTSLIENHNEGFGKLMNPLGQTWAFTVDDLISYLNGAKILCEDVKSKLFQLDLKKDKKVSI